MAHDVWVPLFFVLMLAQGNLYQAGNNHKGMESNALAWQSIVNVLDDATTIGGTSWDLVPGEPDAPSDESSEISARVLPEVPDNEVEVDDEDESMTAPSGVDFYELTGRLGDSDDDDGNYDGPGARGRETLKTLGVEAPVAAKEALPTAEKTSIVSALPSGHGLPTLGPSMMQASSRGVKRKREAEDAMDEYALTQVGKQPPKRARKKKGIKSTPLGIGVVATFHQPMLEFPE